MARELNPELTSRPAIRYAPRPALLSVFKADPTFMKRQRGL